jgi:hypothetical protein
MSLKYIDPSQAIHPLRHEMSDEDWTRMDNIILGSNDECTCEELEAYQDWLYDEIVCKLQTHDGVTTLQ